MVCGCSSYDGDSGYRGVHSRSVSCGHGIDRGHGDERSHYNDRHTLVVASAMVNTVATGCRCSIESSCDPNYYHASVTIASRHAFLRGMIHDTWILHKCSKCAMRQR